MDFLNKTEIAPEKRLTNRKKYYIIASLQLGVWYSGCALVSKTNEMSSILIAPAKADRENDRLFRFIR